MEEIKTYDNDIKISIKCMTDSKEHLNKELIKSKLMPLFVYITELGFVDIYQDVEINLEVKQSE
jgi:hypothetical protein